ncbi:MAG: hypothetical protein LBF89_02275 [Bacteroidales bacterium]|nr:hypothetical protein [Bacteroidales bacterium]
MQSATGFHIVAPGAGGCGGTCRLGNRYGYAVERYTLLRDGVPTEAMDAVSLTPQPLVPPKWNASASINYNYNRMPDAFTGTAGYNLSVQKTFWEAFRCAFNATYSNMTGNEGNTADIFNLRITGGYTLLKKHNFNLSPATVANSDNVRKAFQYSANLAYGYSFGITVTRKDRKLTTTGNF